MHFLEFLPLDDGVAKSSYHLMAGRSGLKVLSEALEFSVRLSLGQFERLAEIDIDVTEDQDEIGRAGARNRLVYLKKRYFGLEENASPSLPANRRHDPVVGELYDLKKEIDELLRSDTYQAGGVCLVIHAGGDLPETPKSGRMAYNVWNRPMELGAAMSQRWAYLSNGLSVTTLESKQHPSVHLINHCMVMYAIARGEMNGNTLECIYERFLQQHSVLQADGIRQLIASHRRPLTEAFHILGRARLPVPSRVESEGE